MVISRRAVVGGVAAALGASALGGGKGMAAPADETRTWQLATPSTSGKRERGATITSHARLFDLDQNEKGVLRSSSVVSDIGGVGGLAGDLATQVLQLGTGTIVGIGTSHARTLEGHYAIVGGTGSHAGARGSYEFPTASCTSRSSPDLSPQSFRPPHSQGANHGHRRLHAILFIREHCTHWVI